jgi:hypothetical protein
MPFCCTINRTHAHAAAAQGKNTQVLRECELTLRHDVSWRPQIKRRQALCGKKTRKAMISLSVCGLFDFIYKRTKQT